MEFLKRRKKKAAGSQRTEASQKAKVSQKIKDREASQKSEQAAERKTFKTSVQNSFYKKRNKIWDKKMARPHYHESFRRSYREEYIRKLEIPGLMSHTVTTFKMIFKHWKTFLPLIILAVILNIVFVGLMSEETYQEYQTALDESEIEIAGEEGIGNFAKAGLLLISTVTTGGLSSDSSEAQGVCAVVVFLILWLATIFLVRHYLAGQKPKLRDALYNAGSPVVPTFLLVLVIFVQLIPIFLVIISYSAAVSTDFLSTPLYALAYFIFAALMIILSCYLLSSSLLALVAVTAPGLYPLTALQSTGDLMAGRRVRFLIRLFYMILVIALYFVAIMVPVIMIDMQLKNVFDWLSSWPIVSIFLQIMSCFTTIFVATYLYLFYRQMLDFDRKVAEDAAEHLDEAAGHLDEATK